MMKKDVAIRTLVVVMMTTILVAAFLNRTFLRDLIVGATFSESAEISSIKTNLELTGGADVVFRATKPKLLKEDQFNNICRDDDAYISILGCYVNDEISLYDIKSSELNGIVESTAAHELLHAVWKRMDDGEKNRIGELLNAVYNDELYNKELKNELSNYSSDELLDELHSRVGTEIKNLPKELEEHYAKYFRNQDVVVKFYEKYNEIFKEIKKERDELESEMQNINTIIGQKAILYKEKNNSLSSRVLEFNQCAETPGCFTSTGEFYAKRSELLAEQAELNADYEEINVLIDDYNSLIKKYNANVLKEKNFDNIINSNVKNDDLIK